MKIQEEDRHTLKKYSKFQKWFMQGSDLGGGILKEKSEKWQHPSTWSENNSCPFFQLQVWLSLYPVKWGRRKIAVTPIPCWKLEDFQDKKRLLWGP